MNIFTITGLFLDIIGVVILYFYGPPISPLLPDGSELVWCSGTEKETPEKLNIAKRNLKVSRLGLFLIFLGFLLQLIGQFT